MNNDIPPIKQVLGSDGTPIFTNFGTLEDIIRRRHQAGEGAPLCTGKLQPAENGYLKCDECGAIFLSDHIELTGTHAHARRQSRNDHTVCL